MKYITLIIGLFVVGCGKQEQTDTNESTPTTNTNKVDGTTENPVKELTVEQKQKALRDSVVGTYENKKVNSFGLQSTIKHAYHKNGVFEHFGNDELEAKGTWTVVGEEVHLAMNGKYISRIEPNGDLTAISYFKSGKRMKLPKESQHTFKKIK